METDSKIKKLLEKFYAGETTVGEENFLREYFGSPEGCGNPEGTLFRGFSAMSSGPDTGIPEGFEKELEHAADRIYASRRRRMRMLASFLPAAAAAAVAAVVFLLPPRIAEPADTFEDPVMAYAEAMKALELISVNMNRGLASAGRNIDRAGAIAAETLESAMPGKIPEETEINQ